jgi:hypothetical protein
LGAGRFGCAAAGHAQFVGPHRHGRQGRRRILGSGHGLPQRLVEGVGHHQQLRLGRLQLRRELGVQAGPVGVGCDFGGLLLPVRHIGAQRFLGGLGIAPAFGRQHLEALRQQHGCFAMHLRAVLQILDALHAFGQTGLEPRQRLARQGGAGLGRITLPGQGIGNVELGLGQQRLGLLGPFGRDDLLATGALELVELLAQEACGTLVAAAQFLEHLLHLLGRRIAREPVADALGTLPRSRCSEGAARHRVEGLEVVGLGRS